METDDADLNEAIEAIARATGDVILARQGKKKISALLAELKGLRAEKRATSTREEPSSTPAATESSVDRWIRESRNPAERRVPEDATSSSHPSLPSQFRSRLSFERDGWDAHVKVDYDEKNPLSLEKIRRAARRPYLYMSYDRILRAKVYKTKKGHHLRVWFKPELDRLPATVILAIQKALGDDPMRVAMNEERVDRGEPGWNVLWNCKYVNGVEVFHETADGALTLGVLETIRTAMEPWSPSLVREPSRG